MKCLLRKLLFLLPVPCIVVGINYFVDPARLYVKDYELGIAQHLLDGNNVVHTCSNFDTRLLQKYYIGGLQEKKEIIVIGSSRAMQISSDIIGEKSFFNNGTSGAVLEDYIAIYNMYRKKGLIPSKVILAPDPWIFNKNNGQVSWQVIQDYYDDLSNLLFPDEISKNRPRYIELVLKRYYQLVSPSYFQESVKILKEQLLYPKEFKGNEGKLNDLYYIPKDYTIKDDFHIPERGAMRRHDGSLVYHRKYQLAKSSEVRALVKKRRNIYKMGNYISDPLIKLHFERFINFLIHEDNVEVVFFLSPFHPLTYNHVADAKEIKNIEEVERYIKKFAEENNIRIIGSYNPGILNLTEEFFFDEMHPKREAIKKIFAQTQF